MYKPQTKLIAALLTGLTSGQVMASGFQLLDKMPAGSATPTPVQRLQPRTPAPCSTTRQA